MSAFLVAILLVIAFVTGSVMALRPSPRQRQLALFRARAVAARLSVQWQPGGQGIDYVLPWAAEDASRAKTLRFAVERAAGGSWTSGPDAADPPVAVVTALARLPASVTRVRVVAGGLAACWNEAGSLSDVEDIASSLGELGALLLAGSRAL